MSVEISEIRPDDHQEVDALLGADNGSQQEGSDAPNQTKQRCEPVLSLVARNEGQIIGTILCYYDDRQGYHYRVTLSEHADRDSLAKALVDKALRKLNAQGRHRCRIRLSQEQQRPFWETAKWGKRPDLAQEPVRSTAVVDRLANHQEPDEPQLADDPDGPDEPLPTDDPATAANDEAAASDEPQPQDADAQSQS